MASRSPQRPRWQDEDAGPMEAAKRLYCSTRYEKKGSEVDNIALTIRAMNDKKTITIIATTKTVHTSRRRCH